MWIVCIPITFAVHSANEWCAYSIYLDDNGFSSNIFSNVGCSNNHKCSTDNKSEAICVEACVDPIEKLT